MTTASLYVNVPIDRGVHVRDNRLGAELRTVRVGAGMSLAALAQRVHYSASHLSKVENGHKRASLDLVRRCDVALGASGRLSAVLDDGSKAADDSQRAEEPDRPDRHRLVLDEPVLVQLRVIFDNLRELGRVASPSVVLPLVTTHVATLEEVARRSRGDQHDQALVLAGRVADFAGWMAQEAGDTAEAVRWIRHATAVADAGGDPSLRIHGLIREGLVAMYEHNGARTVQLARLAGDRTRRTSRLGRLAALREAQGCAVIGDISACLRAVDLARHADPDAEDGFPPTGSVGLGVAPDLILGTCLYELGDATRAIELLERHQPGLTGTGLRTRTRFGVALAMSYEAVGEVGMACGLTDRLLDDVAAVDSATIRADLRHLVRNLRRWGRRPEVREVMPRLVGAFTTT